MKKQISLFMIAILICSASFTWAESAGEGEPESLGDALISIITYPVSLFTGRSDSDLIAPMSNDEINQTYDYDLDPEDYSTQKEYK